MLCYAAWSLGVPPWLRLNRLYEPRILQARTNRICERVCATEYAPRGPFSLRERRHGLIEIVERAVVIFVLTRLEKPVFPTHKNASTLHARRQRRMIPPYR